MSVLSVEQHGCVCVCIIAHRDRIRVCMYTRLAELTRFIRKWQCSLPMISPCRDDRDRRWMVYILYSKCSRSLSLRSSPLPSCPVPDGANAICQPSFLHSFPPCRSRSSEQELCILGSKFCIALWFVYWKDRRMRFKS